MRRSVGVTVSAVIVFIGCAFTLLMAGIMALGAIAVGQAAQEPAFVQYAAIAMCVVLVLFVGWGIATGVGVIQLREWARISMLVFGGLLAIFMGLPAIFFLFTPLPAPGNMPDPEQAAKMMMIGRFSIVAVYASAAVLGMFWIYFFARSATKVQFGERWATATQGPIGIQFQEPPMRRLGRPVSITIIAVVFLVGCAALPVMLIVWRSFIPGGSIPMMFFGRMVSGNSTLWYLGILGAIQLVAAVGLLKLKPWARTLAIALQIFVLMNAVVSFGLPSGRAQFEQMMIKMNSDMGVAMPDGAQTFNSAATTYFGLLCTVVMVGVILWFLIKEKEAFYRAKDGTAPAI